MTKKRPAHVSYYRDCRGHLRWRFRKPPLPESQTRAQFGSEEWWTWYSAALAGEPRQVGATKTAPGSLNALVAAYYASADWKLLSATTQKTYRGIIERFRAQHGDKPIAQLQRTHILKLMDAKAETPAAANNLLKILRVLMRFAVERNMRLDDPTVAVRALRYKTDGFHTWTEGEIAAYEKRWPLGTKERLALDLFLYTAQRSGDVRRMGPQHVRNGLVAVRQEKTGEALELPLLPQLEASLASCPSGHLTFLVTQHGRPYSAKGFGNWFSDAARKAGLPAGVSAHGLRKAAARRLAEAGCTVHEIMSVTGHRTLKEVARYTAKADQKRRAESAMAKVGKTETEQSLSNPDNRLANSGSK
ncbi:MAG: tyrosine-type recombinase/integrase [Ignavibacteriales bacterium]